MRLRPSDADLFYSRDSVPLVALAALRPALCGRLFYEAHEFPATRLGRALRGWLVQRVAGVIVITRQLVKLYAHQLGLSGRRLVNAPDGVRLERFADLGTRAACRETLGLPEDAFIVGYVGQLHLRGMGKGVDTLVEAIARFSKEGGMRPVRLGIVGGPDEMVGELYNLAAAHNLPGEALITPGQVPPGEVPLWMRAFDVCALPSPQTTFFAYYTSPLKLFEYMASGTPIVASDLPAFAEIVIDGESALLVTPGRPAALSRALKRLRDEPVLGMRLAEQAREDVKRYTWHVRARSILAFAGEHAR
jgi:glycosyltransferase involved in cell wall biosynthesis